MTLPFIKSVCYQSNTRGRTISLNLDPQSAEAYYNRGVAYAELGDLFKPKADFLQVLKLSYDPDLRNQAEEQLNKLPI